MFGGPITTGGATGVNMIAYLPGMTQAGVTGGQLLITAGQALTSASPKVSNFDNQFNVRTTNTGWVNAFVFSMDDSLSGATGTFNNVVAKIHGIQSAPTPGSSYGSWTIEADYVRGFTGTVSVPTGAYPSVLKAASNNPSWGVTMSASGPTGFVQVQGGSGTVQFGGTVYRTRIVGN
jgi:hypothetical protein